MSLSHSSLSITAATKTGPFMAFEAAMNDPSGDQLSAQTTKGQCEAMCARFEHASHLSLRKKVFAGELWKGFSTAATSDQSSVLQILTDLSSDCSGPQRCFRCVWISET
jgi:hypothetical protein